MVFGSLGSDDLGNYNEEEFVSLPPLEDQRGSFSQIRYFLGLRRWSFV